MDLDNIPDPVPTQWARDAFQAFADVSGLRNKGQRPVARALKMSERKIRYYANGFRNGEPCLMEHDEATRLAAIIKQIAANRAAEGTA